jgi:lysophospholipase L1-like esterase
MILIFLAALSVQNDKARANSHDDGWESLWVTHCRTVYTTAGKNAGMVLQVGDSITHSNPYSQWPRYGAGKTAEDSAVLAWCMAEGALPSTQNDPTSLNGFYLAIADTSGNRGMTASSGLDTAEFLSGNGNGGTAMPATAVQATARGYVADGATYTANLHVDSVAAAFSNAQFAVVMLGTNDAANAYTGAFDTRLASIVDALEARGIVVVLSTIPPRVGTSVTAYNDAIRAFASTRGLPLIDYYQEIVLRRTGTSWQGTLISGDGVHPTAGLSSSDPYSPGGDASTHTTGDNCLNDGYLLRSWLTVQKLKEVRSYVADGVNPPSGSPPPPAPAPPPSGGGGASPSSSDDGDGCSCGTVASAPGLAALGPALLLALAFVVPRRRFR